MLRCRAVRAAAQPSPLTWSDARHSTATGFLQENMGAAAMLTHPFSASAFQSRKCGPEAA